MKTALIVFVPTLLTACATYGPTWSEISGDKVSHAILHRHPTIISSVDGWSPSRPYPVKVESGAHRIELDAVAPEFRAGLNPRSMALTLEPCKRYFLNAQFNDPLTAAWSPVVDYVEPIAGCPGRQSAGTMPTG